MTENQYPQIDRRGAKRKRMQLSMQYAFPGEDPPSKHTVNTVDEIKRFDKSLIDITLLDYEMSNAADILDSDSFTILTSLEKSKNVYSEILSPKIDLYINKLSLVSDLNTQQYIIAYNSKKIREFI